MGLFGKKKDKEKEKKGFFGWKKRKQEAEIPERDAEIVPPEPEKETDDIAKQILAEREAARQEEAETWRAQAEETIAEEQAEAAALAAKAAQEELLPEDNETEDEEEDEEENETEDEDGEENETEDAEDETEDKEAEIAEDEETEKEETAEKLEEKEPEEKEDKPEEAVEQETEIEETIEVSEPEETTEASESPEAESQEPEASEPETEEPEPEEKKKGILQKIREGLRKTKNSVIAKMQLVLNAFTKIDEDLFEQLEETMIMGDMGAETSIAICDQLRKRVKERGITDPKQIMGLIQEIIGEMLGEDQNLQLNTKPSVIMVIGVNGAGKTTTIGKMCHQFKEEGKKVIVAAADTFRAAAIDQLQVWTDRAGVDLVKHAEGSDPGAVVYDAIEAAKARDCDVLICDTAGRLHNKKNLMNELAKINRILETKAAGCDKEILLVLDATTGQNAVNQARLFKEVADITGIVLTKLDGTAKGGIVVSIKNELQIPVKLIGVGEKIDDLQPFHAEDFVNALFEKEERL
jgi:fused signal recognition particle receptor